jgi:hypothetical protein
MSLLPGLKARPIPRVASITPGIGHNVKVLTTVSTAPSFNGNGILKSGIQVAMQGTETACMLPRPIPFRREQTSAISVDDPPCAGEILAQLVE